MSQQEENTGPQAASKEALAAKFSPKLQRIAYYLGQGLRPGQVASIVGVTISAVSQYAGKDGPEEFKQLIKLEEEAARKTYKEEDNMGMRALALKGKILQSIEDSLAGASLSEQVRALEAITKHEEMMHKRSMPPGSTSPGVTNNTLVVSLTLPGHLAAIHKPSIIKDNENRVVSIDNKVMAPMGSNQVKDLFSRLTNGRISANEKEIPSSIVIDHAPDDF